MSAKQQNQGSASQDYLSSHFEQSRADVTEYATWIEYKYARPALQKMHSCYLEHPLPSVFATIFILLSLPPTAIYIALCLFVLTFLLLSALCIVVLVFTTIALVLGSIFTLVLLTNLLLAIFITFSFAVAYLSYKVVIAGYKDGFSGARLEILELCRAFFFHFHSAVNRKSPKYTAAATGKETLERSRSSSPSSTVIVNKSEANNGTFSTQDLSTEMKLEEEY